MNGRDEGALRLPVPVVRTKLLPPQLSGRELRRTALLQQLGAVSGRRLTELAAPAGYGKTLTAALLLQSVPDMACRWLTLDRADDDLLRFCTALTACLTNPDDGFDVRLLQRLETGQAHDAMMLLLDRIAAADRPTLAVIDDAHHLTQPAVHRLLTVMIERSPRCLHWLVLSRQPLPIASARWYLSGESARLSAADLQLTIDESAEFLRTAGVGGLDDRLLRQIHERSGGWPIALQSALLAVGRDGGMPTAQAVLTLLHGSRSVLSEYLAGEALAALPPDLQEFVLYSSLLERLSPEVCDVLRGTADSAAMLTAVAQRGLFLRALDPAGRWYVFHALWHEFLFERAQQLIAAELRRSAVLRAADRLVDDDDMSGALRLLMRHGYTARMLELVRMHAETALHRHRLRELSDWLALLPPEQVDHSAELLTVRGWIDFLEGRYHEVADGLRRSASVLPPTSTLHGDWQVLGQSALLVAGEKRRIFVTLLPLIERLTIGRPYAAGWAALLSAGCFQADLFTGGPAELVQAARRAFVRATASVGELYALAALFPPLRERGDLRAEVAEYRAALVFARRHRQYVVAREAYSAFAVMGAEALFWLNRLPEAVTAFRQALIDAHEHGNRLAAAEAAAWLQVCQAVDPTLTTPDGMPTVPDWTAEERALLPLGTRGLLLITAALAALLPGGNPAQCRGLQQALNIPYQLPGIEHPDSVLTGILLAELAQRGVTAALQLQVEPLLVHASERRRYRLQLFLLVFAAVAARRNGQPARARARLREALELLERCPFYRLLLLFPELDDLLLGLDHPAAVRLCAMRAAETPHPAVQLSDQELQILRMLATGRRQAEIAAALHISPATVKWYLNRLYRRLGVPNRTAAIAWVRRWL